MWLWERQHPLRSGDHLQPRPWMLRLPMLHGRSKERSCHTVNVHPGPRFLELGSPYSAQEEGVHRASPRAIRGKKEKADPPRGGRQRLTWSGSCPRSPATVRTREDSYQGIQGQETSQMRCPNKPGLHVVRRGHTQTRIENGLLEKGEYPHRKQGSEK